MRIVVRRTLAGLDQEPPITNMLHELAQTGFMPNGGGLGIATVADLPMELPDVADK
jgi:hypothetical protein